MPDSIRIKRSYNTEFPDGLKPGEPHFSYLSETLYIGGAEGQKPIAISSAKNSTKIYRDFGNGATFFVDESAIGADDSVGNTGQNREKPFASIERAILQGVLDEKNSYTILVFPGLYRVRNHPGRTLSEIDAGVSGVPIEYFNEELEGGIKVPPGCSIVGISKGNVYVVPMYVPNACGLNQKPEFDSNSGEFVCVAAPGNPSGIESGIFRVSEDTYISGLSFRDRDFTLRDVEYQSVFHELLWSIRGEEESDLNNWYSKIEKAFDVEINRNPRRDSEISEIAESDIYSLFKINGIKNESSTVKLVISDCSFKVKEGVGLNAEQEGSIWCKGSEIEGASISALSKTGGQIELKGCRIKKEEEAIAYLAEGVGTTDRKTGFNLLSILPPQALSQAQEWNVAKIDLEANYNYYKNGATVFDRFYVEGVQENFGFTAGEIIKISGTNKTAKIGTNPEIIKDSLGKYVSLDDAYSNVNKWHLNIVHPTDYYLEGGSTYVSATKEIAETPFSSKVKGLVVATRRVDDRKEEERRYRLKIRDLIGDNPPEAGEVLYIPSIGKAPIYIAESVKATGNDYYITVLATQNEINGNTALEIVEPKKDLLPVYVDTVNSETYKALIDTGLWDTEINTGIANEDGAEITITPISVTMRAASKVVSEQTDVDSDLNTILLGGGLYKGYEFPSEFENISIRGELVLKTGAKIRIDKGAEINTSTHGKARENNWGLGQIANTETAILLAKGNPNDALVNTSEKIDSESLITTEVLAQVLESKTAKNIDREKALGDSRKYISSSDLSTTSRIGVSRVATKEEIAIALQGREVQQETGTQTESDNPEYVNPFGFRQGMLSLVANNVSRQVYAGSPEINVITSKHRITNDEAGIGKLSTAANAVLIAGGEGVTNALTTVEAQDDKLINTYVLKTVIASKYATSGQLGNGAGEGLVRSQDKATTSLYGIVKLATESSAKTIALATNGSNILTNAEEESSTTLLNAHHLKSIFEGKKATVAQRETLPTTGSDNLLVNYGDKISTLYWGIGKVTNYETLVSDLSGSLTNPGVVISDSLKDNPTLVNRYGFRSALYSLYAQDADLTPATYNGNRIVRAENLLDSNKYGVGKLVAQTDALSIVGGSNTTITTNSVSNLNNAKTLINAHLLLNVLESIRATNTQRENPSTSSMGFITANNAASFTRYGIGRLAAPLEAIAGVGGNSATSPTPPSSPIFTAGVSDVLINIESLQYALKSWKAQGTETNQATIDRFITPQNLMSTSSRGIGKPINNVHMVTIVNNYQGSSSSLALDDYIDDEQPHNRLVTGAMIPGILRSFLATDTQRESVSLIGGNFVGLINTNDRASGTRFGIVRLHVPSRDFADMEYNDVPTIRNIYDESLNFTQINRFYVTRYAPPGQVVEMYCPTFPIYGGLLRADGVTTFTRSQYPDLANILDPNNTTQIITLPAIPSSQGNTFQAYKYIRV